MEEKSTTEKKTNVKNPFLNFLKEWWMFIVIPLLIIVANIYFVSQIKVDGHSMDPTLEDGQRMFLIKQAKVQRFDIVVAFEHEYDEEKKKNVEKRIIKRVIGLPGDKVEFKKDQLYINGEKYTEPYLDNYKKQFKKDRLQETYSYDADFQRRAAETSAFTTGPTNNDEFSTKVPKGKFFLSGDNRPISKDSRIVGAFKRSDIEGVVKFSFWPPRKFGLVKRPEN